MSLTMPHGQHEGLMITELSSNYLERLRDDWEGEEIREAADEEYRRRSDNHDHWYDD